MNGTDHEHKRRINITHIEKAVHINLNTRVILNWIQ